jgi:hypothetical protein
MMKCPDNARIERFQQLCYEFKEEIPKEEAYEKFMRLDMLKSTIFLQPHMIIL